MRTELHTAARAGDLDFVRRELDQGIPVDADAGGESEDAGTPLAWAAASPAAGPDVLRLLLDRGADPNAVADDGAGRCTPLRRAAKAGDPAKVRLLLAAGADAAFRDPNDYTALVDAAHSRGPGATDVARALLAASTPPDTESRWGESPLSVASQAGKFDLVRLILDAGANPAPLTWTPLMRAAALGTADDVAAELARGGDASARDRWERTPHLLAVHAGDVAKARLLLDAGSDPAARSQGRTALMLAADAGRLDALRWLLAAGADPNEADEYGTTPLMEAADGLRASDVRADCVRALLAAGANHAAEDHVRGRAVTAAMTVDVLRALADAGADLNYVDGTGHWPLELAAGDGDLARLDFLLSAGADPERTSTGATALHSAARWDHLPAVQRLLAAGAAVNVLDVDGYTPLHEARSVAVARALLAAGADVRLAGGIMGVSALDHHADTPRIYDVVCLADGSNS